MTLPQNASESVLIVEDEPTLARALERAITAAGYRVEVALTCEQARRIRGAFYVGIFDLDLPDGSGLDLAKQLRLAGRVGRLIFYTACTDAPQLAQAAEHGRVQKKQQHNVSQLVQTLEAEVRARRSHYR
jgi:DNA-binding response OmpR family regulator